MQVPVNTGHTFGCREILNTNVLTDSVLRRAVLTD